MLAWRNIGLSARCGCFGRGGRHPFSLQTPRLAEAESSIDPDALQQTVRKFVREEIIPNAAQHDETGEYPFEAMKKAHALGIMNTELPESLGGVALPLAAKVRIFEEIAYGDSAIGTSLMVNELAQIPLMLGGSDFLKDKYLKRMLREPLIAAYAVTESDAGSDLANAKARAVPDGDDHFVLNGSKIWITNAGIASWYFVLARTGNGNATGSRALTGFVVEREMAGVTPGKKEKNMGQRCSDTRTLTLDNVRVPRENVVGELGGGFILAMKAFDRVRPIVASMACGITQRALDEAMRYALERKTFGKRIIDYQGVSFKVADMALRLEAARALTRKSAQMVDERDPNATYYSSCAKVTASEIAFQAAADAVQIFGGNGFNTEFPVEKLLRDSKILQIYGGTNEIQRVIITKNLIARYS